MNTSLFIAELILLHRQHNEQWKVFFANQKENRLLLKDKHRIEQLRFKSSDISLADKSRILLQQFLEIHEFKVIANDRYSQLKIIQETEKLGLKSNSSRI